MIEYTREVQQEIPQGSGDSIRIIGVGGAGANIVDRLALEEVTSGELLALHTDVRDLASCVTTKKIQIGKEFLKGMGSGGDPALGREAARESREEIEDAVRHYNMVFICVGLGGGTGSGAAPEIARLARAQKAFVVVVAAMPFSFEGARRLRQAEEALGELDEIADLTVTFENDRMGELVLAKQGLQEALSAADRIVSESIQAVTGIISRPGLIRIGLDELLSALRQPDSRAIFGFGRSKGKNRANDALRQLLKNPLLDGGAVLKEARDVVVHISGGDDLTFHEVQSVMKSIAKHCGEETQVHFGTGHKKTNEPMLELTVISSLPVETSEPEALREVEQESVAEEVALETAEAREEPETSEGLAQEVEALEEESLDEETCLAEPVEEMLEPEIATTLPEEEGVAVEIPGEEERPAEEAVAEIVEETEEESKGIPQVEPDFAEEAVVEEAIVEEPFSEEPVAEEPSAERPLAEEPLAEELRGEGPLAEEPVVEDLPSCQPLEAVTPRRAPRRVEIDESEDLDLFSTPRPAARRRTAPLRVELDLEETAAPVAQVEEPSASPVRPRARAAEGPPIEEKAPPRPVLQPLAADPVDKPPFRIEPPFEKVETVTEPEAAVAPAPRPVVEPEPSARKDDELQEELSFEAKERGRFKEVEPTIVDGEDLDVPTFLRRS
ncbi:MAG: hypothetical protein AAF555_04140 [Verrucomicrobiota bacterium]